MATTNSTPRAGLPQWGANDQVKFMTDMSTAFSDIDKKFALTGDAVIPCTATYDTATKRHTLTPTQTGITLHDIFTARFLATTAFTAGDKVYIGGAEYVTSYTDGDTAVETGAWIVGAVVSLDCKKAGLKAYVGAGFGTQLSHKVGWYPQGKLTVVQLNDPTYPDCYETSVMPSDAVAMGLPSQHWNIKYFRLGKTGGYGAQIALPVGYIGNGIMRLRVSGESTFETWSDPITTATPPQEFDLLCIGGHLHYRKNQFGWLTIDVQIPDAILANIIDGTCIATMPATYCPKRNTKRSVPVDNGVETRTVDLALLANGQVIFSSLPPGFKVKTCLTEVGAWTV